MKKFARMSLVAAVAVAGLTTANAKPLEEAIKGVDISGSMVYRYDEIRDEANTLNDDKSTNANNFWKIATTIKAPVNDYVTASVRISTEDGRITDDSGLIGLSTSDSQDANPSLNITNANFTVTTEAVTVVAGKQGLNTPWTVAVDPTGNEQTGTGIVALGNAGPVTLAAAYFNQTNLGDSGDDMATLTAITESGTSNVGTLDVHAFAVIVPVAGFTFDAWYLQMQDTFQTFTAGVAGSVDLDAVKLGIDARYAELTPDRREFDTQEFYKLALRADMGIFGASLAYAGSGENGGLTSLDDDAKTTYLTWMVTTNGYNTVNADLWHAKVDVDLMDGVNLAASYATMDSETHGGDKVDTEEAFAQLSYKMSANLNTYVRYGILEQEINGDENIDRTRGRLNIQYSF